MTLAGRTNPLAPSLSRYNPTRIIFSGYIKDEVFRTKVGSGVEFHARINNAVDSVTPQILENTWLIVEYPLNICEQQMALMFRSIELDELFFQLK
jgi:hypothetical protein